MTWKENVDGLEILEDFLGTVMGVLVPSVNFLGSSAKYVLLETAAI
jgi:hypothetical protein